MSLIVLATLSWSASGQETLTGTELQGLTYANPGGGPGTHSEYVPGTPGYANLYSPDNVVSGLPGSAAAANMFNDTGTLLIPNGYLGSFGNLNNILAQGAAGNVSFDLASMTPGNESAYWDVVLVDPNNSAFTITINAYSDNKLGANPFNSGESVDASTSLTSTGVAGTLFPFGDSWTTVAGLVEDGNPLGDWNVADLSISVGAWDTGDDQDGHIDAITLPGGPIPDAASTLSLLGICFGALAGLRLRMRRD